MIPEDLERLEALLRGQPLRGPSAELDRRLAGAWSRRARVRKQLAAAVLAAALAVAGGLVVMLAYRSHREEALSVPQEPALIAEPQPVLPGPGVAPSEELASASREPPIQIERVWCTPVESQVVTSDDTPPVLQERRQVTRELRWVDEQARVTMEWTISDEQTAVVPWDYQ